MQTPSLDGRQVSSLPQLAQLQLRRGSDRRAALGALMRLATDPDAPREVMLGALLTLTELLERAHGVPESAVVQTLTRRLDPAAGVGPSADRDALLSQHGALHALLLLLSRPAVARDPELLECVLLCVQHLALAPSRLLALERAADFGVLVPLLRHPVREVARVTLSSILNLGCSPDVLCWLATADGCALLLSLAKELLAPTSRRSHSFSSGASEDHTCAAQIRTLALAGLQKVAALLPEHRDLRQQVASQPRVLEALVDLIKDHKDDADPPVAKYAVLFLRLVVGGHSDDPQEDASVHSAAIIDAGFLRHIPAALLSEDDEMHNTALSALTSVLGGASLTGCNSESMGEQTRRLVPHVVPYLTSADPDTAEAAALALGRMTVDRRSVLGVADAGAVPGLVAMLAHPSPDLQSASLPLLHRLSAFVPALPESERKRLLRQMYAAEGSRLAPALVALLEHEDAEVQSTVLQVMTCTVASSPRLVPAALRGAGVLHALERLERRQGDSTLAELRARLSAACIRDRIARLDASPSSGTVQCATGAAPVAQRCEGCGRVASAAAALTSGQGGSGRGSGSGAAGAAAVQVAAAASGQGGGGRGSGAERTAEAPTAAAAWGQEGGGQVSGAAGAGGAQAAAAASGQGGGGLGTGAAGAAGVQAAAAASGRGGAGLGSGAAGAAGVQAARPQGAAVGGLLKCSGCNAVRYCSHECQRADWPRHKALCKLLKQAARDATREALEVCLASVG